MSSGNADDQGETDKRICACCVGESYLKEWIQRTGVEAACAYCAEEDGKTITIGELADQIEKAFEEHYERTSDQPNGFEASMLADKECNYNWERHGEEVIWAIAGAAEIEEECARDVLSVLEDRHGDVEADRMGEECEFASDSYYEKKSLRCTEHYEQWHRFEESIKTESRFFNREAAAILSGLFSNLPSLQTSTGQPVVVAVGPESGIRHLFRARVFAGENGKLEEAIKTPWKDLGSPPMTASSAGRMNARGISVFYGADDAATAIAEVRPPVGSQVAVARFEIVRTLRLLDVQALKSVRAVGSIFDPEYLPKAKLALFLEVLSARIVRPVMPNDEAFEYLATQAIADYLASESRLDGIIFPSVQTSGAARNVVLFHHAARVVDADVPKGTVISAHLEHSDEDGCHPDYWVWEAVPPATSAENQSPRPHLLVDLDHDFDPRSDYREASLRIELESVKIHHVKNVSFTTEEFDVRRSRSVKSALPDF